MAMIYYDDKEEIMTEINKQKLDSLTEPQDISENEFGTKNITPLFWKYSLFAFAGLLLPSASVIADGIFVGNGIGAIGLATIGVINPFWVTTVAIIALLNAEKILVFLGATPEVLPAAMDYAVPFLTGLPFSITGSVSYYFARVDGQPLPAALGYMLPAIIAIVLEFLMISKWGFGMRGVSDSMGSMCRHICTAGSLSAG